ncbi:MAG TPA: hypothetical protein ENI96_13395 [Sedimenticola thiotaurini]|uniref:Formyl transferase N-terminal domain-containing protein n=1 Tax=Sedimenticola thiotaurini TaxID=1543721 RepID=A0A831RQ38_9GAMM|nr:hypothetical protein [Sedimenticola thiotaurini]
MDRRRVVFCTYPGIYSSLVLERLLRSDAIEVVGIVCSSRVWKRDSGRIGGGLELVQRTGLGYAFHLFCITGLFELLYRAGALRPVQRVARERSIARLETVDINSTEARGFLLSVQPDVILCANFNQRLGPAVLEIPRVACLNIHPSLLPRFRGVDPVFHALLRGETRLGVSLHHMDRGFDTGDLLAQGALPAVPGRSQFLHYARLFELGAEIAVAVIPGLEPGQGGADQGDGGEYDSWPTADAVADFARRGWRLLTPADYLKVLRDGTGAPRRPRRLPAGG